MKWFKPLMQIASLSVVAGLVISVTAYLCGAQTAVSLTPEGVKVIDHNQTEHWEKEEDLPAFHTMKVDVGYIDLTVRPGDSYGVDLRYYTSAYTTGSLDYEIRNGVLTLEGSLVTVYMENMVGINAGFDNGWEKSYAVITVPQDAEFQLVDLTGRAQIYAEGFTTEKLRLDCPYGDAKLTRIHAEDAVLTAQNSLIYLTDFTADTLEATNQYGSITLDNSVRHSFDRIKLEANNGDIALNNFDANELKATNWYGSLWLEDVNLSGELRVEMNNGQLEARQVSVDSAVVSNGYGSFYADSWSSNGLDVEMSNGDLRIDGAIRGKNRIENNYGSTQVITSLPPSDYYVEAETSYGNIWVSDDSFEKEFQQGDPSAPHSIRVSGNNNDIDIRFGQ